MSDWKAIVRAIGLELPQEEVDRIAGPIAGLEPVFLRAAATLEADDEPAVVFHPEAVDSAR